MKPNTLLLISCLMLYLSAPVSAQEVISHDPRGLVLGLDLGAATYDGDAASAFDEYNTGVGLEAYYNLSRRLAAGLTFSASKYGVFDSNRNSLGLGVRLRMRPDRISPYVGLGAHITNGGEKTGLGPTASLGIEFAATDRAAFFLEGGWRGSVPDEAVDELDGDAGIDHLLAFGAGVRFRLTQPKNPRFAVEIDAPDTVLVGDISVLRAHVTGEPTSEVYLSWALDQVSSYRGPEVRHVFDFLGPQTVTVAGRNKRYEVRASKVITVVEDESYRNPDDPLLAAQPSTEGRVRIIEIYGNRTPAVGEAVNFRVRLQAGAIWPVNYLWDMGDGTSLIGNNVLQRYERPGMYTISVVARNRLSADTLTTQVEVQPRGQQPVVPPDVIAEGQKASEANAASRRVWYRPEELRGLKPVNRSEGGYGWVVGSYLEPQSAEQLMRQFRVKGFRTGVITDSRAGASTAYRVVVGQFSSTGRAVSAKREIQRLIATPITLLDIANPSVTVGARTVQDRVPSPTDSREGRPEASVDVDRTTVEAPPGQPTVAVRSALPVNDVSTGEPRAREPATAEVTELRSDIPGPQIKSLKVYIRDERLLLFLDGVSDSDHGINRVEYRVFSDAGDPLSNWSEVSLVPRGRSSYGLQMHRVPVPDGLETAGGRVEVRAVNAEGGFSTLSATIGTE